jgi:hypothetical protein
MALIFNTPIMTPNGVEISNAYGRISVADQKFGTTLQCGLDIYASEAAFTANAQPFNMPELAYVEVDYNRDADGVDVLDLAHDAQMTKLSSVGISTTKVLGE